MDGRPNRRNKAEFSNFSSVASVHDTSAINEKSVTLAGETVGITVQSAAIWIFNPPNLVANSIYTVFFFLSIAFLFLLSFKPLFLSSFRDCFINFKII